VKLTKCQNHHHHGGVFNTWTEWAKPQTERTQAPVDRLGHKLVRPAASWTRVYMRRGRSRRWRKAMKAIAPSRSTSWLGRPATTWRVIASAKLVDLPDGPINILLRWKSEHTHHSLEIPLAKL
jgi:hypothetical protein